MTEHKPLRKKSKNFNEFGKPHFSFGKLRFEFVSKHSNSKNHIRKTVITTSQSFNSCEWLLFWWAQVLKMEKQPGQLVATTKEFIRILKGEEVNLTLENSKAYKATFDQLTNSLIISNIIVKELIVLEEDIVVKSKPDCQIIFDNNIYLEAFVLKETKVSSFLFRSNSIVGRFNTHTDAILSKITIEGKSNFGNIFLSQNSCISQIILNENAKVNSIKFSGDSSTFSIQLSDNSEVTQYIVFIGRSFIKKEGEVIIDGNAKYGFLKIKGRSEIDKIELSSSHECGKIDITNDTKVNNFDIYGNSSIPSLDISLNVKIKYLKIKDSSEIKSLSINTKSTFESIVISDKSKIGNVRFNRITAKQLLINGVIIENALSIKNSQINETIFQGTDNIQCKQITIDSLEFSAIRFINLHSFPNINISNSKPAISNFEKHIEMTSSLFNHITLTNNDFKNLDYLIFKSSVIDNSVIVQTNFPEHIIAYKKFKGQIERPTKNDKHQAKLFYEQLKTSHNNLGNKTEAIYYQAKELDAQYSILEWNLKNLADKVSLAFNKYTTVYGTDWLQGLAVFLITSILLYTITLLSTEKVILVWPWEINNLGEYTSQFFEFINPTTNLLTRWNYIYELEGIDPKNNGEHLSWQVGFWLYASKFIMVTLYYQVIQAFRRLGKS